MIFKDFRLNVCVVVVVVALHVYLAPLWLLKVFMMIRIVLRNTFDTFLDWYLGYRLERVIEEHRVTKIIHLLRGYRKF